MAPPLLVRARRRRARGRRVGPRPALGISRGSSWESQTSLGSWCSCPPPGVVGVAGVAGVAAAGVVSAAGANVGAGEPLPHPRWPDKGSSWPGPLGTVRTPNPSISESPGARVPGSRPGPESPATCAACPACFPRDIASSVKARAYHFALLLLLVQVSPEGVCDASKKSEHEKFTPSGYRIKTGRVVCAVNRAVARRCGKEGVVSVVAYVGRHPVERDDQSAPVRRARVQPPVGAPLRCSVAVYWTFARGRPHASGSRRGLALRRPGASRASAPCVTARVAPLHRGSLPESPREAFQVNQRLNMALCAVSVAAAVVFAGAAPIDHGRGGPRRQLRIVEGPPGAGARSRAHTRSRLRAASVRRLGRQVGRRRRREPDAAGPGPGRIRGRSRSRLRPSTTLETLAR